MLMYYLVLFTKMTRNVTNCCHCSAEGLRCSHTCEDDPQFDTEGNQAIQDISFVHGRFGVPLSGPVLYHIIPRHT